MVSPDLYLNSNAVKINSDKLQDTAEHDKNVKYGVVPVPLAAYAVQNDAEGIGETASKQEDEKFEWKRLEHYLDEREHAPAHAEITNH